MKYGYVSMAITIFGFCLHAVMRQAFPITRHYNHQPILAMHPIMDIWTHNTPFNVLWGRFF